MLFLECSTALKISKKVLKEFRPQALQNHNLLISEVFEYLRWLLLVAKYLAKNHHLQEPSWFSAHQKTIINKFIPYILQKHSVGPRFREN